MKFSQTPTKFWNRPLKTKHLNGCRAGIGESGNVIEVVAKGLSIEFFFEGEVSSDIRVIAVPIDGLEHHDFDTVPCLKSQRHRRRV